jgi:hypothetical protein
LTDIGMFANIKPQTHDAYNQWSNFEGTPGVEIYEPLKSTQGDIVVKKFRYSGFMARNWRICCARRAVITSRLPVLRLISAATGRRDVRLQNHLSIGL